MSNRVLLVLGLALALGTIMLAAEKKGKPPAPGTVFHFSPTAPKYATCDIEFRDPGNTLWPSFFYGKPAAEGTFTAGGGEGPAGGAARPSAAFTLLCDAMAQRNGDQSRRVLGELVKNGKPPVVTLKVQSFGALRTEKKIEYHPAELVLEVDGKKATAPARVILKYTQGKGGDTPESVYFEMTFTLKSTDLGLKNGPEMIDCRAGATGFVNLDAGKKK